MKIGIAGYKGRVGQLILNELQSEQWQGMSVAGGSARTIPQTNPGFLVTQDPKALFEVSDCVIDFTLPESTLENAKTAASFQKPLVIGTTGLTPDQEEDLKTHAAQTPIVYAHNMSVGVTVLMALVEDAARKLDDSFDIDIFEAHHTQKLDAPSGTAISLGRAAAKGRNITLEEPINPDRSGKRESGSIGFSVARGGDIIGEHTVFFAGQGERLELTHRSANRALYAKGALKAALWLKGKAPGLYSMRDVLGI